MPTNNKQLIEDFYTGFSNGNATKMTACYHDNVIFEDPAFGRLENGKPFKMWEMLMSRKKESTTVVFSTYEYGDKNRKVVNNVTANFKFKDGKIIEHIDSFDLWSWTKQALGFSGVLLGWSSFMRNKIQKTTNEQLNKFIKSN